MVHYACNDTLDSSAILSLTIDHGQKDWSLFLEASFED